jgi:hypothetical protein
MDSYARYFPKGYGCAPSVESVLEPRANEAIIFDDFFHCRASYAFTSGPCGHSTQIPSVAAPIDAECYHSDW